MTLDPASAGQVVLVREDSSLSKSNFASEAAAFGLAGRHESGHGKAFDGSGFHQIGAGRQARGQT
jgi:hypothetical protein